VLAKVGQDYNLFLNKFLFTTNTLGVLAQVGQDYKLFYAGAYFESQAG
jgi:hypothetical protein